MVGIKYIGPVLDGSGYAEFARNFIYALSQRKEVDLTVGMVSFETNRTDHGKKGALIRSLVDKKIPYSVNLLNLTPNFLPKMAESGKTNIIFTMFETTRIPDDWVSNINKYAQACFVPCEWNKKVFASSGVTVPIFVVRPGLDQDLSEVETVETATLSSLPGDKYMFYSVFQWTERKNPIGLLKAYLSAFDGVDDVCLVLKTYGSNNSTQEQDRIKDLIRKVRDSFNFKKFAPPIIFVGGHLTRNEMLGLHKRGDCFVLPHRAEGFGLPHFEAMAMGKPIITTGFSGNMDFCTKDNCYLLDYQMTPVNNMKWISHYVSDMEWAEPNLSQLKAYMRHCYQDRGKAIAIGETAREEVLKKFTWENASTEFLEACYEVTDGK